MKPSCLVFVVLAVSVGCLFLAGPVAAQRPGGAAPAVQHGTVSDTPSGTADLIIQLQDGVKNPLLQPAKVTLRNSRGDLKGATIANFRNSPGYVILSEGSQPIWSWHF